MGLSAGYGIAAAGVPAAGDKANAVLTGAFTANGPSQPFAFEGSLNLALWASLTTALTTTQGSNAATVASGTGIAPGTAVNSVNVPPGTTWGTFSGTSGTLVLPTITLDGDVNTSSPVMRGLRQTAGLLGATVTGPGIPPNTTVTAIVQPNGPNDQYLPLQIGGPGATNVTNFGQVRLSNQPTAMPATTGPRKFNFALSSNAIVSGTDANAVMTGAGITYSASIQLERTFDGGQTWLVCNQGGAGTLAQYNSGTPVNVAFGEPELQVYYRLNCTSYTSGVINYRMSETGGSATTLALGPAI